MTCLSTRVQAAAADLAGNLTNPPATSVSDRGQSPQSLASGAAGVALLHATRARSGDGDWHTAHAWLSAAARHDLTADADASLFFGVPALAFVAHTAADQPGKLTKALAALDAKTTAVTRRRLTAAHARMDRCEYPALAEFDLIRGLTGLGVYHLRRHPHHDVTKAVLAYLVRLTEPSPADIGELPGWWTNLGPAGRASPDFPGGHANVGMAHGIAGPLALLSLALRHGVAVDGHTDAIARICAWLDEWQQQHPSGPWWPYWVAREQLRGHSPVLGPGRPSWCYGTAGLARAQQLAGLATGDTARQRTAETALVGCLSDPAQLTEITDPGLCHGLAGLTHSAWRMTAEALTPDIAPFLPELHETLLTQARSVGEQEFLTGTAGVALALHTAGTGAVQSADWDACLLLS